MATSFTLLAPNHSYQTEKTSFDIDEATPAMEFVKRNKQGRKPTGKGGPIQKKKQTPQRGMGVEKLERLRIQDRWKKMTEITTPTTSSTTKSTTQFPNDTIGTGNAPLLHGLANYGVPMMISGGSTGGLWGWGDHHTAAAGLMMQRVVGNGGFGGGFKGTHQLLVGAPSNVQFSCAAAAGVGFVEASKELSSMPTVQQYSKPDRCDVCFKKKRCNGENMRFNGGLKQFGQVFPKKEADDFPEYWNLQEYNQNINEEMMLKGFSSFRASRSASAYASQYHMKNINEAMDAFHRKGIFPIEHEFFPVKSSNSSKEWNAEGSVGVGGEASHANASNCVDLSLKLSY